MCALIINQQAMNLKITSFLFALSVLLTANSCDNTSQIEDQIGDDLPYPINIQLNTVENSLIKSDQTFAFEFFSKVFAEEQKDENKNFMISPFSLSMALAMTWSGSDNETKIAIQETLKMSGMSDEEVNNYFKKLKESFEKTDPSTKLAIANSIWTNDNIKILPEFLSLNQKFFNATVEAVDFSNSATAQRINQWAEDKTNGLIKEIIEETSPRALMYLLNALYFKGIWTSEFDAKNTSKMKFIPERGNSHSVDMMQQNAHFNYASDETMQLIELPYGNQAFSMMVLLPQQGRIIADISRTLQNKDYWDNMKRKLRDSNVDLFLPKFKTEYSKQLNSVLKDMGMDIAFTPNEADFSRMSDTPSFISFVKQLTYIATDEVGTEAAAVTVVGMGTTSFPSTPEKVTFKADRPFIYIIQENSTGSILFMGVVNRL